MNVIDHKLAAFIVEVRKIDGTRYPGPTLKNILAVLHRKMKESQGALNVNTFLSDIQCCALRE